MPLQQILPCVYDMSIQEILGNWHAHTRNTWHVSIQQIQSIGPTILQLKGIDISYYDKADSYEYTQVHVYIAYAKPLLYRWRKAWMLLLFRSYQEMGMIDSHGCYFV